MALFSKLLHIQCCRQQVCLSSKDALCFPHCANAFANTKHLFTTTLIGQLSTVKHAIQIRQREQSLGGTAPHNSRVQNTILSRVAVFSKSYSFHSPPKNMHVGRLINLNYPKISSAMDWQPDPVLSLGFLKQSFNPPWS